MDFLELSAAKYSGVISPSKSCFLPSNKFSLIKTSLLLLLFRELSSRVNLESLSEL
jgi:hypothetical protein